MANDHKFKVKNGLVSQNVTFVDDIEAPTNTITASMLNSDTLSYSGNEGQLFSISDSVTGTIFAVNDVSGIPSIEVDDDGTIRLAETFGNVLIGTAVDNGTDKLQVAGDANVSGNLVVSGTLSAAGFAAGGNTTYADNEKAIFGDGSDLQIYHNGNHSFITDAGTGDLKILGANVEIGATDATVNFKAVANGNSYVYYNGNERIRAHSSGTYLATSVGVGTTVPNYPFEVMTNTTGLISRIYNTNANGQGLLIRAGSTASNTRAFQVASENDTKIMTVTSDGNVGIGTASPGDPLVVYSSGTMGGANTLANSYLTVTNGSNSLRFDPNEIVADQAGDFHIANVDAAGKIVFQTGGTSRRMTILENGNVGIATDTPRTNFHVEGTSFFGEWSVYETDTPPATGSTMHVHTLANNVDGNGSTVGVSLDDATNIVISTGANETGAQGYQGALWFGNSDHPAGGGSAGTGTQFNWRTAGIASLALPDTGSDTNSYGDLQFYTKDNSTSTAVERMRINYNGATGIGTTNPQSILELYDNPPTLMLTSSSANAPTIEFKRINTSATWGADNYTDFRITDESGYLRFKSGYNGTTDTILSLYGDTTTTKVGINTDTPNTAADGQESLGIWSAGATGGGNTKTLALYNNNSTTSPADALTAYNGTTSYPISQKASYTWHARSQASGNIHTIAGAATGEPVNIERIVALNNITSSVAMTRRDYFAWDGAGSAGTDMVPSSSQVLEEVGAYNSTFAMRLYADGTGHFSGPLRLGQVDSSSGHINAYENLTFNIDSDNDDADTRYFAWYKNGINGAGTELMRLHENGKLGIGHSADPQADVHLAIDINNASDLLNMGTTYYGAEFKVENQNQTAGTWAAMNLRSYTGDIRLASRTTGVSNATDFVIVVDNTTSTYENFVIKGQSGNVGISASDPHDRLTVQVDNAPSTASLFRSGTNLGTNSTVGVLSFDADYSSSEVNYGNITVHSNDVSGVRASMDFAVKSTTGSVLTGMTLYGTNDGVNVGIGHTAPQEIFEVHGTSGQLFAVSDDLTGTIFSVNDISGIPSIEVIDDGTVLLAEFVGNVGIGTNAPSDKLHVSGTSKLDGTTSVGGDLLPTVSATYDLGSSALKWQNLELAGSINSASITTTGAATVGGNLTVDGDLTVNGTTTTINSTTLTVDDLNITLASGAASAAAANGAGWTVDGANATVTYDSTDDSWEFNKRVGINTTGVIAALDVAGQGGAPATTPYNYLYASAGAGIRVAGNEAGIDIVGSDVGDHAASLVLRNATDGFIWINDTNQDALVLRSFTPAANDWHAHGSAGSNIGSSLVKILSAQRTGNVGIGTESPSYRFDVQGSGTSQAAVAKITRNNASASNNTYTFEVDSSVHTSNMTSGGAMAVDVNAGRAFTIDGFGRAGIGTATPAENLHVYGGASETVLRVSSLLASNPTVTGSGIDIVAPTANTSPFIRFYDTPANHTATTVDDNNWAIGADDSGLSQFSIVYAGGNGSSKPTTIQGLGDGSAYFTILSSGYVGIGSTIPTAKLEVKNGSAGVDKFVINDTNNNSADVHIRTQTTSGDKFWVKSQGQGYFAGDVGIGISTPTNRFEVHGTAGQLFSVSDSVTGTIFAVNDVSGIPSIEVDDDGTIRLAEEFGNILVGTAIDDGIHKLQINGKTRIYDEIYRAPEANDYTALRFGSANRDVTLLRVADDTAGVTSLADNSRYGFSIKYMGTRSNNENSLSIFADNQTGTQVEAFSMLQNGWVGIGQTVPTSNLTVNGGTESFGINLSGTQRMTIGADGTWNYIKGKSGQGFRIQTTGFGDALTIENAGDVGIGTANPETKLHLYEAAASPVMLTLHNYQADINGLSTNGNFIDFKMTDDNATATPQVRIGMTIYDSDGSDGGVPSEGNGNFVVYTNEGTDSVGTGSLSEKFRVSEKGRVGIGTTIPSEKLHIGNGNIYIESDTATGGTGVGLIMFGEGTGADPSLYMGYDGDGMSNEYNHIFFASAGEGYSRGSPTGTTGREFAFYYDGRVGIGPGAMSTTHYSNSGILHVKHATTSGHYDSNSHIISEGADARIQILADDSGANAAGLILSADTKHWAIHHRGSSVGSRLKIGYATSGGNGDLLDAAAGNNGTNNIVLSTSGAVMMGRDANASAQLHVSPEAVPNTATASNATMKIEATEAQLQINAVDTGTWAANLTLTNTPASGTNRHWTMHHAPATYGGNEARGLKFRYQETNTGSNIGGDGAGTDALVLLSDGDVYMPGKVGIGHSDPQEVFEVHGTSGQLFAVSDDLTGTIFSVNDISGVPSIEVVDDGTVSLAEFTGNVGIGTNAPATKLHVIGNIYSTGDVTAYYSDERLKNVQGNITGAVDKVKTLNGFYYTGNDTAKELGFTKEDQEVGVSAQQVEQVLPEAVSQIPGNEEYKTVKYERMVPLLIEAIKDQQAMIDELRAEIDALKNNT